MVQSSVHGATLRDGHYFSGLPKNIIIKATMEIWAAERSVGIMDWELRENTTAQSHCSFLKSDFYCDMIEVIIPCHSKVRFG